MVRAGEGGLHQGQRRGGLRPGAACVDALKAGQRPCRLMALRNSDAGGRPNRRDQELEPSYVGSFPLDLVFARRVLGATWWRVGWRCAQEGHHRETREMHSRPKSLESQG
mmetsp:Transcript_96858/g.278726  ORF Transcript_96858/g.278726 Transcript_96858/m.278726 type:complete len:110 (-) Transcript_96858:307-636(-)